MARRDVPEDVAARVLDRFTEVGLVDDAGFADVLVRSRHESRGLARRALAVELRRKGVGDEDARAALAQIDDADEEAAARALLVRRWRQDGDPPGAGSPDAGDAGTQGLLARPGGAPGARDGGR